MNKENKKGQRHGYWELIYNSIEYIGKVGCKCTLNNGMYLGYREWYDINGNGKIGYKEINI